MPCCHIYTTQLVEHVRETYYKPHSITLGGVPNMNIVRNVPRLPNSSANYRGGNLLDPSVQVTTCTLTLATLANPSHNSRIPRVHPPSRATTQEMSFQATTQKMSL